MSYRKFPLLWASKLQMIITSTGIVSLKYVNKLLCFAEHCQWKVATNFLVMNNWPHRSHELSEIFDSFLKFKLFWGENRLIPLKNETRLPITPVSINVQYCYVETRWTSYFHSFGSADDTIILGLSQWMIIRVVILPISLNGSLFWSSSIILRFSIANFDNLLQYFEEGLIDNQFLS